MALGRLNTSSRTKWCVIRFCTLLLGLLAQSELFAFTLTVEDETGAAVTGFRWVLEEDTSYRQPAGTFVGPGDPGATSVQGFNFYKSYMPVVGSGSTAGTSAEVVAPDPAKHYFLSVLASTDGYQMSGRPVAPGQTAVRVVLQSQPTPTAQIFVKAFEDTNPINNAWDTSESGLGGFTVKIDDTVDLVKQDVFGNMLGTVYARDANGEAVLDGSGNPTVQCPGDGVIRTVTAADVAAGGCRNPYNLAVGEALVKNLHPNKYGVQIVPPTGTDWQQTATIEGTKTVDAWVKANEPKYFAEFGAGVWHAFFGFVRPFNILPTATGTAGSISGQIVNMHMSRPPELSFWPGQPLANCWVGLNESLLGGLPGRGLYAAPCGDEGNFSITGVPPGTYQMVMFDRYLLNIFGFHTVVVPAGGNVALGQVPVFRWFGNSEHYVFYDENENGIRDLRADGTLEPGIPEQAVNIRFRDGSIHMAMPTDMDGYVPFEKTFPFFFWQVAEVDFLRYKATGVTVRVDAGGQVDPNPDSPGMGVMTPQLQPDNNNEPTRTETGPVLTQGFQQFLGTSNIFEWGKKAYAPGENGGVSGIVHYATTRAENDPRLTGAEDWEPGIPRVQVNLYQDDGTGKIKDVNGSGAIELADVDNHPFGWSEGGAKGPEDFDRNNNGIFDSGDAINIATTDSWDDNLPAGCPGNASDIFYQNAKCYDGLRNYNQVRPALFDGGYAFTEFFPKGWVFVPEGGSAPADNSPAVLPAGLYIVEAATPPGYVHQKEEDKNVDFGDTYKISPLTIPPPCVGDPHTVPAQLTLFPGVDAPYAGEPRPLCDRKQVFLADRANGAADFFMFTEVPVAGHMQGFVLNDLANEFDVNNVNFGEKQAMPFLPISIRDWTGREVNRVYTDQYGNYNGLVPGTFTNSRPSPSGVAQSMHQICVNDPMMQDPAFPNDQTRRILDPNFSRQYTQFCYTMNFQPGRVTFLDTPVLPIAAFANLGINPVDSEFPDSTPMVYSVDNVLPTVQGPWVANSTNLNNRRLTIVSAGTVQVANPAFTIEGTAPKTIARDFGFGATQGTGNVRLVSSTGVPRTLTVNSWSDGSITATLPASGTNSVAPGTYQLIVTRANGIASPMGVTVTVGGGQPVQVPSGGSIQAVIDAPTTAANALILVPPGNYEEMIIMHKPVRLQGWGAGSTIINGTLAPTEKVQLWRSRLSRLIAAGQVTLLPDQADPLVDAEGFLGSEGAPIFVIGRNGGATSFTPARPGRIDGFTIMGSNGSGGVAVNGYANSLTVSNNRIVNNQGIYGGGVRLGLPLVANAFNDNVNIRNNQICENGTLGSAGGGIALHGGSDSYAVIDNWICANFAQGDGAGVAHVGLSARSGTAANPGPIPTIKRNKILFNQTFEQTAGAGGAGGGILIAGTAPAAGALTTGSGSVNIEGNLIQGNQSGTGDGAGIAVLRANGTDVNASRFSPGNWYTLNIIDNMIVNNVTGLAGGGIALQDALRTNIMHNTVARNDSTATAQPAFVASPACNATVNRSCLQPAGIVSRRNSAALQAILPPLAGPEYRPFSNPTLVNNIVWQNRSFYYDQTPSAPGVPGTQAVGQLLPDVAGGQAPIFTDLAVLDITGNLDPRNSVLTSTAGYHASNTSGDPAFVAPYYNGSRGATIVQPEFTTNLTARPALDEGGNFIEVRFGPLALTGNYHIGSASSAAGLGNPLVLFQIPALLGDIDANLRPDLFCSPALLPDAGADEIYCAPTPGAPIGSFTVANQSVAIGLSTMAVSAHAAGSAQSAVAVRTPTATGGTVTISSDKKGITYTPATNWSGTDTVVAVVSDASGQLRLATSVVNVAPSPDGGIAESVPSEEEVTVPAPIANVGGSDAGTAVAASNSSAVGSNAGIYGAPVAALSATALADTRGGETQVAKAAANDETVEPAATLPGAQDHELVLSEYDAKRTAWVFRGTDILDSATGAEGRKLTVVLVGNVKQGHVKLHADGSFEYAPPKSGLPKNAMHFSYRVSDGKQQSETATVTFTVMPAKDIGPGKAATTPAKTPAAEKPMPNAKPGAPAHEAAKPKTTPDLGAVEAVKHANAAQQ